MYYCSGTPRITRTTAGTLGTTMDHTASKCFSVPSDERKFSWEDVRGLSPLSVDCNVRYATPDHLELLMMAYPDRALMIVEDISISRESMDSDSISSIRTSSPVVTKKESIDTSTRIGTASRPSDERNFLSDSDYSLSETSYSTEDRSTGWPDFSDVWSLNDDSDTDELDPNGVTSAQTSSGVSLTTVTSISSALEPVVYLDDYLLDDFGNYLHALYCDFSNCLYSSFFCL